MNQMQMMFAWIRDQARAEGLPDRPRAILREYLQTRIVTAIFGQKLSGHLSFVGGTALRLLHGLPRFSEDLDFDNLGLKPDELRQLFTQAMATFSVLGVDFSIHEKTMGERDYYEVRFPKLLFDLGISTNNKEKLMIKLDSSSNWRGQRPLVRLFAHWGEFEQVQTNPLEQVLVQKLAAYAQRKQMQPRDMFDVMWLYARGARLDQEFLRANNLGRLVALARERNRSEGLSKLAVDKLRPFLFNPAEAEKLAGFSQVLDLLER